VELVGVTRVGGGKLSWCWTWCSMYARRFASVTLSCDSFSGAKKDIECVGEDELAENMSRVIVVVLDDDGDHHTLWQ